MLRIQKRPASNLLNDIAAKLGGEMTDRGRWAAAAYAELEGRDRSEQSGAPGMVDRAGGEDGAAGDHPDAEIQLTQRTQ